MIRRQIILAVILITTPLFAQKNQTYVEIILDSSGSMAGLSQGKPKIDIAKQVFEKYLTQVPTDVELGLRVYGHRQKKECGDIELIQPIGAVDKTGLLQKVKGLKPLGMTPITDALEQAAKDLESKEGKRLILLITDGIESCHKDPCAFAKKLSESKIQYFAEVVGFDIKEKSAMEQLTCIAKALHGNYYSANNAEDLFKAISQSIATVAKKSSLTILSPMRLSDMAEVYDATGKKISEFLTFYRPTFAPGTYKVIVKTNPQKVFENVVIKEGEDTVLNVEGFGKLKVDAPIALSYLVSVKDASGKLVANPFYSSLMLNLGVGLYRVEVNADSFVSPKSPPFVMENVEIKPNETTEIKMTGYGFLKIAVYNPLSVYVDVLDSAGKKLVSDTLASQGQTLPIGSYKVVVKKPGSSAINKEVAIRERETTVLEIP